MDRASSRVVRVVLACAVALLAGGILDRQQAACEGCQPGNFTYDNPVGCDASCHVIFSGKLTGTCNSSCEASVLQGRCVGTKGSCTFHRDWVVKSCGAPPAPPPAPSNTAAPIPANTDTAQPPPAPTGTAEVTSTPAPTSTALPAPTSTPASTDTVLPSPTSLPPSTDTALPSPTSTPPPTDTPLPSPTPTDTPQPTPTSTSTPVPTPTPRPPELTSEVSCSGPGDGGWCRVGATLQLQASDPQGLGVVIHGDLNGNPFKCEAKCSLDLPEGQGTANFEAVSNSGKTAAGSASWKLDSVPPEVVFQLQGGTAGKHGWYTAGPVDLACTATDATSGIAGVQYRADQGAWGDEAVAQSDGPHTLECQAIDVAGNASHAQAQAKIDSESPTTHFAVSQNAWLAGAVSIKGKTVDGVSGLANVEFALDSQSNWTSLESSSDWSYSWDTRGSSDGAHTLYARGEDVAGNLERPQSVQVRVDNTPPQISLASSWNLGQAGKFAAEDSGVGTGSVKAVFSGNGIQPRVVGYTQVPAEIAWDGIDGSGAHVGYGTFQVVVTACDLLGNCATAQAQILDPAPPPPRPTRPRPSPTSTSTPTLTPTHTSTATPTMTTVVGLPTPPAQSVVVTRAEPTPPPKVEVNAPEHWMIWPFVGLLGLIVAVGGTYAVDGRARELRALRKAIELIFITNLENQFEAIAKGEK